MDGIKYFFGLDKEVETADDNDRIELKTDIRRKQYQSSLSQHLQALLRPATTGKPKPKLCTSTIGFDLQTLRQSFLCHQARTTKKSLYTSITGLFLLMILLRLIFQFHLRHESLLDSLVTPMISLIKRRVCWRMPSSTPTPLLMNAKTSPSRV